MRYINLLPVAASVATAIVLPDDATAQQLGLDLEKPAEKAEKAAPAWWDSVRSAPEAAFDFIDKRAHNLLDQIETFYETDAAEDVFGIAGLHGGHGPYNLTLYQAINLSNYTKKFAALVNDFPDVVDLLNSTKTNSTVFIPLDKAFEKIPDHGHKPPKEFVEKVIEYHVLSGVYPAGRVLASHTLPTSLKSKFLGDCPQRLRASLSLFGLKLNFFSKIVKADQFFKNGVAHGVDNILVPPPPAGRTIQLFPSKFSTLELAAKKTGLFSHHEHGKDDDHKHFEPRTTGLTIFAPTNNAFARLGPAANAFLFNTEKGLGFLRALLKYHIVMNETLYSDAYYGQKGQSEDIFAQSTSNDDVSATSSEKNGHFHVDLPTLLDGKHLSIDIARFFGFITMTINGAAKVAVEDGVCLDGVIHVMGSVLFPPRTPGSGASWTEADGEISVEELVDILQPYVDEDGETNSPAGGDQVWGEL
ncbi:FAS1 domain-containing protein [Xylaria bambusicola]|uniref:FAS1 domain-containing protein n=1 Tax=Xylaria bambusicola TaxID=326684 RepID=UPI0020089C0C|nr:FAS1 domain-containing protein [Xylaria bambusicola]KAI0521586.1 FAS1 domain-containing protein [Xylaria bambusicola]